MAAATVVAALCSAVIVKGAAQGAPAAAAKTTQAGVYTEAQAEKGEELYYGICVSCHPRGYYTGASFKKNWGGRPLSDLYDWIKTKMPKNDPGTLTPNQSVQVMAYILQQNKMPSGSAALTTNRAVLKTIKIQLK
jgi:mono/diheme cytochrome c family protein